MDFKSLKNIKINNQQVVKLSVGDIVIWNAEKTAGYGYQVANTLSELSTDDNINYGYTYDNSKWNVLNTNNQYEQYGVYEKTDDINSITKYEGKLALSNGHEYQYTNGQWNDVGEASGGSSDEPVWIMGQTMADGMTDFPKNFKIAVNDTYMLPYGVNIQCQFNNMMGTLSLMANYNSNYGDYSIRDTYGMLIAEGTVTNDNEYIHFNIEYEDDIKPMYVGWYESEPLNLYSDGDVGNVPVKYDKTIFDNYHTVNGYPFASFQDIPVMGKGVIYNIDGYLYKNQERTTENPYSVPSCFKDTKITEIKLLDENITEIGSHAFENCQRLSNVVFNNNLRTIGEYAFCRCLMLQNIDLPDTVTEIGEDAFIDCRAATSLHISTGLTEINTAVFQGCSNLVSVNIPDGVRTIGQFSFLGCTNLTSITISDSVTNIVSAAFSECNILTTITIGTGINNIGYIAFENSRNLTSITVNAETEPTLANNVFSSRANNGTLYTPNSTDDWSKWLSQLGTGWTQVKKFVAQYGYQVANTLSELSTDDNINYGYTYDNSKWNVLNTDNQYEQYGIIEETNDINSITKYEGKLAISNGHEYQYTNGQWNDVGEASGGFTLVTTLRQYMYWEPDKVFPTNFQVKREQFDQLTQSAMDFNPYIMCNDISVNLYFGQWGQYYDIYDNMTQMSYRGEITQDNEWVYFTNPYEGEIKPRQIDWMNQYTIDIYANQQVIPVKYDKTIFDNYSTVNGYPFASLQDIPVMGKGIVYNIDGYLYKDAERTTENPYSVPYCFSGSTLSEIKLLDENITVIGENAFSYCDALSSVTLGSGIKELQGGAFLHCIKLENIVLPDSLTAIRHHAFSMCSGLTTIEIPSGVTIIERYAFTSCNSLSAVTVPASVITIEENAFMNCYIKEENFINNSTATGYPWGGNIYKVVNDLMIVNDTEVIGGVDKNITEAIIPDGITTIRKGAFSGYTNLSTVTVPVSVTKIDERTFSGCTNLLSVELNEGITSIGQSAFEKCAITSITIPNSVTMINNYAFRDCNNMTSLTIGSGTKWIYNYVFWNCTSLTSITITIQDSNMRIQEYAFMNVPSSGTLYCYKSWFDGLDAYNMSHIKEIIYWNKVYFDAD